MQNMIKTRRGISVLVRCDLRVKQAVLKIPSPRYLQPALKLHLNRIQEYGTKSSLMTAAPYTSTDIADLYESAKKHSIFNDQRDAL